MTDESDETRFPSIEQFKGWYNLGYERDDGWPVLRSASYVPEFEHGEFFELYVTEHQWFEQLVPVLADKPFDPLAEPPIFVRSDADDRTLDVDADCECVTIELIERIQKEFLGRYPLWRVYLCLEVAACSIVIYPNAVRYGNLPLGTEPAEALRQLIPQAAALREKRMRPQRAELAFLQARLPAALQAIGNRTFAVIGVLDNSRAHHTRLSVYLLIRGADEDAVRVAGPPGADNDFLWTSSEYGVNASGAIISCPGAAKSAAFCVCRWLPPADYRGPLTIVGTESGERYTYEVKSENITHLRLD